MLCGQQQKLVNISNYLLLKCLCCNDSSACSLSGAPFVFNCSKFVGYGFSLDGKFAFDFWQRCHFLQIRPSPLHIPVTTQLSTLNFSQSSLVIHRSHHHLLSSPNRWQSHKFCHEKFSSSNLFDVIYEFRNKNFLLIFTKFITRRKQQPKQKKTFQFVLLLFCCCLHFSQTGKQKVLEVNQCCCCFSLFQSHINNANGDGDGFLR